MGRYFFTIPVVVLIAASLSGCAQEAGFFQPEGGSLLGYSVRADASGEAYPIQFTAGSGSDDYFIGFHGRVDTGRLNVVVVDASGQIVWNPGSFGERLSISDYFQPPAAGTYRLGVQWEGRVDGQIEYWWRKMAAAPSDGLPWNAYLGSAGMLIVSLGFLGYAIRQRLPWKSLGFGALAWFLAVFIKNFLTYLFSQSMYQYIYGSMDWGIASPVFSVYIGFLTGVTEVLLFWLFFRFTSLGRMSWTQALAFGIGFGVFEAFFIGMNGVLDVQAASQASVDAYTPAVWTSLLTAANPVVAAATISERFSTILIHIFCMVAILYAVQGRDWRWLPVAFMVKWVLDALVGYTQIWGGLYSLTRVCIVEGIILAIGLACWWGIRKISRRYPELPAAATGKARTV
jgi:uncharacterized membrane protein YhfC